MQKNSRRRSQRINYGKKQPNHVYHKDAKKSAVTTTPCKNYLTTNRSVKFLKNEKLFCNYSIWYSSIPVLMDDSGSSQSSVFSFGIIPSGSYESNLSAPSTELTITTWDLSPCVVANDTAVLFSLNMPDIVFVMELIFPTETLSEPKTYSIVFLTEFGGASSYNILIDSLNDISTSFSFLLVDRTLRLSEIDDAESEFTTYITAWFVIS